MKATRTQRGSALILVLWFMAALSLLVLVGAHSTRQQTQRMAVDLERLHMELVLDAALQLGAQRHMAMRDSAGSYRRLSLQLGKHAVRLEIIPSGGLVDVRVASDELLQALFERVGGLPAGEAESLRTRLREWLQPQEELVTQPASNTTVNPAKEGFRGGLDELSQLQRVPGITPELYETIAPFLGINGQSRIQLNAAPPALIDALTGQAGLGERIHAAPVESRESHILATPTAELFAAGRDGAITVKMQVAIQTEEGRWWQRTAWLDLNTRPGALTPWTTLWLEPTHRIHRNASNG